MRDRRREWVNAAAALGIVGWLVATGVGCKSSHHAAVGDLGDAGADAQTLTITASTIETIVSSDQGTTTVAALTRQ